ncbi:MAG: hypothetical protein GTO41_12945, partial [Burkholderiales bacterium]|nr:hypothetical protein [Burkholderiales bacterium]
MGQSFTGDGNPIGSIRVRMKKVGSPTGNMVMKLYAHSGTYGTSSVPTGPFLTESFAIDVSGLPTSLQEQKFSFGAEYTLSNGTYYCLSFEYDDGDASNRVEAEIDASSPTHGGNCFEYLNSVGDWTALPAYDAWFQVLTTP